ncbi:hypothetical protein MLAC_32830 [Mycobacterium lacus]|uniref:Uncharacterized protein n=1 Tax=Mycobacterium lacus TaxID=169765 RepID=A0A7I7NNY4_9MYCO|nr:hypothetical protein MLAC_32830 [Mycobacterium lacus]
MVLLLIRSVGPGRVPVTAQTFGYGCSDLERVAIDAVKSAFVAFGERLVIIDEVIKPRFAALIG